ncbi:hypothetical protein J6590_107295, partial [Homalodisca vitripennis]
SLARARSPPNTMRRSQVPDQGDDERSRDRSQDDAKRPSDRCCVIVTTRTLNHDRHIPASSSALRIFCRSSAAHHRHTIVVEAHRHLDPVSVLSSSIHKCDFECFSLVLHGECREVG